MKIMHIENDERFGQFLKEGLARFGFHVDHYYSTIEALQVLRSNPTAYQIVICDGDPGEFDALLVVNEIKETNPQIRIIAQSNSPQEVKRMIEGGVEAYAPRSLSEDDRRALVEMLNDMKNIFGFR